MGREKLDEVFAHVFKGERAIVRPHFVSGTHALATTLQAILGNGSKGKEFVYAVGQPYDTMQSVIGASRHVPGSLTEQGFIYKEVPLVNNTYDLEGIRLYHVICRFANCRVCCLTNSIARSFEYSP